MHSAIPPYDRDELLDLISDAISDSMDMDWVSRDGARSVLDALVKEGVVALAPAQAAA